MNKSDTALDTLHVDYWLHSKDYIGANALPVWITHTKEIASPTNNEQSYSFSPTITWG